jgi:hypothetical protein
MMGDYLHLPITGPSFIDNITSSDFSVSLWYRPVGGRPMGAYELLIGRGTPASTLSCPDTWGDWSIGLYSCRKAVAGYDMNSTWQTTGMACGPFMASVTGLWHHLALVQNGGVRTLYVDNMPYATLTGPCGAMHANIGDLMLGRDYTGDLDDIVIYNRALLPSEVNDLMHLTEACCYNTGSKGTKKALEQSKETGLKIYPNPTDGRITVSSGNSVIRSVSVYTATGSLAGTYYFSAKDASINMGNLASGVYFIKVTTDAETRTEKLIKN